jgi:hypothetical protein
MKEDYRKLKNYTSQVPASRSVAQIEERLVQIGAKHIAKSYEGQRLVGIIFQIDDGERPLAFKLPANVELVTKIMLEGVKKSRAGTQARIEQQAERTAWKLLLDWVEVETSRVLIGRRKVVEVFLGYLYDFRADQTLYERLAANDFKMLPAPKESAR